MTAKLKKPRALKMQRNADFQVHVDAVAECDEWQVKLEDDDRSYQCGRTVRVPALCFDESDAKAIRKLAAWLEDAAQWMESKPLATKAKR